MPGDRITVHLQELQELLGLLSISCFLLGRERVIGDQQRVGPATWGGKDQNQGAGRDLLALKWVLQLRVRIIIVIKTKISIIKTLLSDARTASPQPYVVNAVIPTAQTQKRTFWSVKAIVEDESPTTLRWVLYDSGTCN